MLTNLRRQNGISLIELMVGIAIALILLTGVLTLMLRISTSGASSVTATRLNQQVRGSMDFVTKELQRAGYVNWYAAWDADDDDVLNDINSDTVVNVLDFYQVALPIMDRMGEVTLWKFPTPGVATGTPTACTTNCDCVLYSFDLNEDGFQGVGSGSVISGQNTANFELFGVRRNNGAIEQRTSGNPQSCTSGDWTDLTDENVNVTDLALSMSYATAVGTGNDSTVYRVLSGSGGWAWDGSYRQRSTCTASLGVNTATYDSSDVLCLLRRNVKVAIDAQSADDTGVSISLQNSVKLKNELLDSSP